MWLLIFQRDFSNSMGKKKPNLRPAHANPCRRQQPHWRTCYMAVRRLALCTTGGFLGPFPSHVHPSLRQLQPDAQLRHGVLPTRRFFPSRAAAADATATPTTPHHCLWDYSGGSCVPPSMP